MNKIKEQIIIDNFTLDCNINIVDPDTDAPSEIHVWLDDNDIMLLTEDNDYHNITEQMALISSTVKPGVKNVCRRHGINITCECFGVTNGKCTSCTSAYGIIVKIEVRIIEIAVFDDECGVFSNPAETADSQYTIVSKLQIKRRIHYAYHT